MCIVVQIRHKCSIGISPYLRKINSDEEIIKIFGTSFAIVLDVFTLIQDCHFTIMAQLISGNIFCNKTKIYTLFNIRNFILYVDSYDFTSK